MGWKDTIRTDTAPPQSSWRATIRNEDEKSPISDYVKEKGKQFADATADSLPMIGGMVGGVLGTPADIIAGPGGNIAGAAMGGALGKAGQNLYNSYMRPELAPKENSEYLTQPLQDGAIQGALQGVGEGIPVVAKAAATSRAGQAVGDALSPVGKWIADKSRSAMGSVASVLSGVDKDAALRQYMRPVESRAMEQPKAVYNASKQALADIDAKGVELGKNVGKARDNLVASQGQLPVPTQEMEDIIKSGEEFLKRNKPSSQGYSAISPEQREELQGLLSKIKSGNVEDFVKAREHLDHVEALASKYGSQTLTPYERELMNLRGQMNESLGRMEPKFKGANEAFENLKDQKGILGLNRESTAESGFNNLFSGANKSAKQSAAEQLLQPETLEKAKDIGANKAFQLTGPAGSEFGFRNMLRVGGAVPTMGLSVVLTSPKVWQHGLRGLGELGTELGTYGPVLEQAAIRGPQALSATYKMLSKDPAFRKQMKLDHPDPAQTPFINRKLGNTGGR